MIRSLVNLGFVNLIYLDKLRSELTIRTLNESVTLGSKPAFFVKPPPSVNVVELEAALKATQPLKASGPDGVPNELLTNCGETLLHWLLSFVNTCLANNLIPKMWRQASVIAILKPGKPRFSPESYRPISLQCSSFKLFDRLILNRINPIIDPLLPTEQACFLKADQLQTKSADWLKTSSRHSTTDK